MKKIFTLLLAVLTFYACSQEVNEKSLLIMCGSANKYH